MSKASQRGFTLIELVVVIVILGVLAAFAVPRFMGLEAQARIATLNGVVGSLRSASAMAHSLQLAQGLSADTAISVGGDTIAMSNGYPAVTNLDDLLEDETGFDFDGTTGEFKKLGASDPDTCKVIYTAAAGINTPPAITTDFSGC